MGGGESEFQMKKKRFHSFRGLQQNWTLGDILDAFEMNISEKEIVRKKARRAELNPCKKCNS